MTEILTDRLLKSVAEKIRPFAGEIINGYPANIHSFHIVGSAVTEDFDEKTSDINSVVVLKEMDLKFVEFLAPLGKKYRKQGISAPLIMTPEYVRLSLDVFPIEFLDFKLKHVTVYGDDIFRDIEIGKPDLRQQCEREIKIRLIGLRQGYISSLGDRQMLTENFISSIAGYIPLFRGIILLTGKEPPLRKSDVISGLSSSTGVNTDIFRKILDMRKGRTKPGKAELDTIFEDYYSATEKIGKFIDELQV